jgi:hypothetical protein
MSSYLLRRRTDQKTTENTAGFRAVPRLVVGDLQANSDPGARGLRLTAAPSDVCWILPLFQAFVPGLRLVV